MSVNFKDSIVDAIIRFTGIEDPNGYVYDYNPCFPFSTTEPCTDVHVSRTSC